MTGIALVGFVVVAAFAIPWDPQNPVPGGSLALPSPDQIFSSAEIARAESYSRWARVWGWSSLVINLVVLTVLGLSARGRRVTERLPGPWPLRVLLVVVIVSVLARLATLPMSVAAQVLRRRSGLSDQGWGGFAADAANGTLVTVVATTLVAVVLLATARRWQQGWPAVSGLLLAGLVLAGSFAYPVVVEPLFNSFASLPDGPLRTQVLALAEAEEVPVSDVLVADASRRTTTLNAYVSGFGSTRRVVLYDNLVNDLPQDQALSVVAHELAHARHRDVVWGSVLGGLGAFAAAGALGLLASTRWLGRRHGDRPIAEPAVVPLLIALTAVATLAVSPIENGLSRQIETRADVDALLATGDGPAFEAMQVQLARRSLADPTPPELSRLWFSSHPTTLQRIALARRVDDRLG